MRPANGVVAISSLMNPRMRLLRVFRLRATRLGL